MRFTIRACLPWLFAVLCAGAGCAAQRTSSHRPTYAGFHSESIQIERYSSDVSANDRQNDLSPLLAELNASYLRAEQEERLGLECCVDHYYDAAMRGWQYIESAQGVACDPGWNCAWRGYHASLARLIVAGQRFRRLDPRCRLMVQTAAGPGFIPIVHNGFSWHPADFQSLDVATDAMSDSLQRRHRRAGVGVPVVAQRFAADAGHSSRFVRDRAAFTATVVLRAGSSRGPSPDNEVVTPILEIVDPTRVAHAEIGNKTVRLAGDFTAPFGVIAQNAEDTSWLGFLRPGDVSPDSLGLIFLEPYQPGKIPVIFVHGLLSDPTTWLDLVNDLRACPAIAQSYQFWAFRYATGQAFVKSAAELRRDCDEALHVYDPAGRDASLHRMVLIGHSMGGLVSKLQVTHSGLRLWSSVASVPPQSLRMAESTRRSVYERLFFEPQPFVQRVVFIGTPHGGSSFASRFAGRIGSMLVEEPEQDQRRFQRISRDNPGMLAPFVRRGLPTSVDLLQPDNPALNAMRCLPVNPCVHLHSIIGTGRTMIMDGPADGIVPVESARHHNVDSELFVDTTHSDLHRHPDTIREVTRILMEHVGIQYRSSNRVMSQSAGRAGSIKTGAGP